MSEPTNSEHVSEPTPQPYESAPPTVAPQPTQGTAGRMRRYRISASIVIVLAAGLIVWLAVRDRGDSSSAASDATAVSVDQLKALATSVVHPIFWVGPKADTTYELARLSNGTINVRYLPQGVKVGAKETYLTVATYPFPGAFAAIQAVAKGSGITAIKLVGNGLAETSEKDPTSVHAAYPGVDYQAEIFDPSPGAAATLVRAGRLAAFGKLVGGSAAAATPEAASPARLKAVAASLGHPIYWAGPKQGYTYELAQTADGQVTVRYLPPGQDVGASEQYLTFGTYPYPKAFEAIQALAQEPGAVVINLPGGGLAVVDRNSGKNIHVAYPGPDYQVEIFGPSPAAARHAVSSGRLKSIG